MIDPRDEHMAIIRVERSDDPSYLCSRHGPRVTKPGHGDPAEAVIIVHASEIDSELAAALSEVANRVSEGHSVRLGRDDINDAPSYDVTSFLLPANEIPDEKLAHIEKRDGEVIVMYDEARITPELAARLAALTAGPGATGNYNGRGSA